MNVFQHGVLHGLGWVAILADGWILHTDYFWLSAAGVWLLIWSFLHMHKEVNMTTENGFNGTAAEDLAQATSGQYTFAATKMPIGDIKIQDGKAYYRFNPKLDMTGHEASLINVLFMTAVMNSRGIGAAQYDYMAFVRKHKLERHFEEELS